MAYLIDTNIILTMVSLEHPMCAEALNALGVLRQRGEERYLTHQNIVEFWRSATRPVERNGLGMSISEAQVEQRAFRKTFPRTA